MNGGRPSVGGRPAPPLNPALRGASVCLVTYVSPAETDEPIKMPLAVWTRPTSCTRCRFNPASN